MKKVLHCWAGREEWAEKTYGIPSDEWAEAVVEPATCMLEAGHSGPHEWTPDENIAVRFTAPRAEAQP